MPAAAWNSAASSRSPGRLQLRLAATLAVLLLAATVAALPHVRMDNLQPFAPHGWFALGLVAELDIEA